MVILGVNGWFDRSHDAAACLIVDGVIVAAVEEEKIRRQKKAYDCLPTNAINACLAIARLTVNDVDQIFWGWDLPQVYAHANRRFDFSNDDLNRLLFPEPYHLRQRVIPVEFVSHHLAHAISAFVCSGFSEASVVVIDGQGETQSSSIWRGDAHGLTLVREWPVNLSLGYFYEAACLHLGFSQSQAGKLMGLAAYGNTQPTQNFFDCRSGELTLQRQFQIKPSQSLDDQESIVAYWREQFCRRWGNPNERHYYFDDRTGRTVLGSQVFEACWIDIAAQVQLELERVYGFIVSEAVKQTGLANVALAGGVALNCSANGSLRTHDLCQALFIQPASHDAGCALGAALYGAGVSKLAEPFDPFLGPSYSNDAIRQLLVDSKLSFSEPANLSGVIADSVSRGLIVGLFQGRGEFGPRALGARSIIADPRSKNITDAVNDVKGRERWRPIAPSVTPASAIQYFEPGTFSAHMLERVLVKSDARALLAGVTHVDGSARPHLVRAESQPLFIDVLRKLGTKLGVEVSVNTSFNTEREPIVYTPIDALHTFSERGIDQLAIGPFLVTKRS